MVFKFFEWPWTCIFTEIFLHLMKGWTVDTGEITQWQIGKFFAAFATILRICKNFLWSELNISIRPGSLIKNQRRMDLKYKFNFIGVKKLPSPYQAPLMSCPPSHTILNYSRLFFFLNLTAFSVSVHFLMYVFIDTFFC